VPSTCFLLAFFLLSAVEMPVTPLFALIILPLIWAIDRRVCDFFSPV